MISLSIWETRKTYVCLAKTPFGKLTVENNNPDPRINKRNAFARSRTYIFQFGVEYNRKKHLRSKKNETDITRPKLGHSSLRHFIL